jgi:hypothetical protein
MFTLQYENSRLSLGAICPALMTFCYNFWSYAIVCILFGVSLSAWPAVTSSMLVSFVKFLQLCTFEYKLDCICKIVLAFYKAHLGMHIQFTVFEELPCPCFQVELLGLELLTSAFGVLTCIRGLSAFLGPPLGGFVIDATSPQKIVEAAGKFEVH